MGGWIRALQVSSDAVVTQFSESRAKQIMREDIADYYSAIVSGLHPRVSERPNFLAMRDIFAGLRTEMTLEEGKAPTKEQVDDIAKQAKELAALAHQRQDGP
jgi:hypothetical protein